MIVDYRDKQYLHPLVYALWGLTLSLLGCGIHLAHAREYDPLSSVVFGVLLLLVVFMALCGRMVITVNHDSVLISFGWLGVFRKRFELGGIARADVCLARSVLASWAGMYCFHRKDSRPFLTRGQRGVRIHCGGEFWFVPSRNPALLKAAILGDADTADDTPEYLRHGAIPAGAGELQRYPRQTWLPGPDLSPRNPS